MLAPAMSIDEQFGPEEETQQAAQVAADAVVDMMCDRLKHNLDLYQYVCLTLGTGDFQTWMPEPTARRLGNALAQLLCEAVDVLDEQRLMGGR